MKAFSMPIIHIETLETLTPIQKKQVMKAANDACIEALKIPQSECYVRIIDTESANFYQPELKEVRFFVEIKLFAGRSDETKRKLYELTDSYIKKCGVGAQKTTVALNEISMPNWGIDGVPASDVKFGYKVNI